MATFFPQHTVEWRLEEPRAFRRLSLSLIEMALLTGIVLRLLRALTFTHGRASWLFYGAAFVVAAARLPDLVRTLERFGVQHRLDRNHLLAVDPAGRILAVNGVRSG
jgi:hypothetical protein